MPSSDSDSGDELTTHDGGRAGPSWFSVMVGSAEGDAAARWAPGSGADEAGAGSRGSRNRKTAIRFLTWKDMAELRKEVVDMVAQVVSWAEAGGHKQICSP